MGSEKEAFDFIKESNFIEGITRVPTDAEMFEHVRFTSLDVITIKELERFVSVYQPEARLRGKGGLDVRAGFHTPIGGGIHIRTLLQEFLEDLIIDEEAFTPYQAHVKYETLHPFTDCNGRSGRALWAWHMKKLKKKTNLSFLHYWYYQSLDASRRVRE